MDTEIFNHYFDVLVTVSHFLSGIILWEKKKFRHFTKLMKILRTYWIQCFIYQLDKKNVNKRKVWKPYCSLVRNKEGFCGKLAMGSGSDDVSITWSIFELVFLIILLIFVLLPFPYKVIQILHQFLKYNFIFLVLLFAYKI